MGVHLRRSRSSHFQRVHGGRLALATRTTRELEREIDLAAPKGLEIQGFGAQPVRFRRSGPRFDAVVLWFRRDCRVDAGAVLLYVRAGKLLFEAVWEYRWIGDGDRPY